MTVGVLLWIGAVELLTEIWYRRHETNVEMRPRWSVSWPSSTKEFAEIKISERARSILRYSEGRGIAWRGADSFQWKLIFLRWEPGKNSAQLAKAHTPDICLPGSGYKLQSDLGMQTVPVGGLELPFRQFVFRHRDRVLHVFYCLWNDRSQLDTGPARDDGSVTSRLEAVLAGRRHLGQQVLEIAVAGPSSADEALTALRATLPGMLQGSSPEE